MTGENKYYYPDETGSSGSAGKCRLEITERWEDESNSSTVTLRLQVNSTLAGNWQVAGSIKANGAQLLANNELVNSNETGKWTDCWAGTITVAHGDDGKAELSLEVLKAVYGQFCLIYYSNISYILVLNPVSKVYRLHENELGAAVYIGADKYDCYIGNGSTYERYTVKIGSGTSWE